MRSGAAHTMANTYRVGSPPITETGVIAKGISEASTGMAKTSRWSRLLRDLSSKRNKVNNGTIVAHVLLKNNTLRTGID